MRLRAFLSICARMIASMPEHACMCLPTIFIQVAPLDPADAASSAAALLRDAETVVRWREEEQTDWGGDQEADDTAGGGAASSADADMPSLDVPPPLQLPPPLHLPLPSSSSAEPVPPPPAREPPLNLSDMHLPLHGMLQLHDGSTQVVDEQWTFRAVACLLQVRELVAKIMIATASGGAVSPATAVVPVDYVMPNDGLTECHQRLRKIYEPAIRSNWESKHGRPFVLKSGSEPKGCNMHTACPAILILCQHHIVCACHACHRESRHCGFACWPIVRANAYMPRLPS